MPDNDEERYKHFRLIRGGRETGAAEQSVDAPPPEEKKNKSARKDGHAVYDWQGVFVEICDKPENSKNTSIFETKKIGEIKWK